MKTIEATRAVARRENRILTVLPPSHPTGEWVTQQARNLISIFTACTVPMRFLVRDRDAKFTATFNKVFRSGTTTGIGRIAPLIIVPQPVQYRRSRLVAST